MSSGLDKEWISSAGNIESDAYRKGICDFIQFIIEKGGSKKLYSCPCRKCHNANGQFDVEYITLHLLKNGMDEKYTLWYFHGEDGVVNQTQNEPEHVVPTDTTEEVNEYNSSMPNPPIDDVCDGGHESNVPEGASIPVMHKETKYDRLKRLAKNPLYPPSLEASKHSTMHAFVKLNDLKTEYNLSDSATEGVLGLLKELLPEGNELGTKFHEMKCTLKEADLNYVTYDVCENNCMLFWKDHINSTHCTKCKTSRYKVSREESGTKRKNAVNRKRKRGDDVVHVPRFTRVARKVMRYFPIIPRLKRLYSIEWIANAMTWHHRAKTCAEFMRHPRDSADWRAADRNWRGFSKDPRSVRLALATDGFNPNGCFGASYSCWPVILQPLNLPPSLTMKSEFSMLTVLIPGPSSPKSNMDVFLQPLVDDLNILWKGVDAWDAGKMEPFNLKAMLLWCIHDFPAFGMLSGCVYQGKFACPICSANTPFEYLTKSMKTCYLRSRKASEAWKKYKGKLRKLLKGNDIQKWLDACPEKKVRPDDWETFCYNEADSKQLALRERNKRIKNEFGKKSTHNTGRLGYARAEEKFREENNGRKPMRVELWLYTHKTKEGGYAPHDEELARKFEALLAIMRQNNEVETLDSGPIFDMFGVDKRGRVRCVGSTISRKALLGSAFARQLLEEVDIERDEWREKLNSLEESNEKILAQMNELVEGLRSGKYNHFPNQSTPSNELNNGSNNDFGLSSYTHAAALPCAIMSHTGKIVAYGTKIPVGNDRTVNGHVMQPREAKVLIDEVKDRSYAVWGGEQDGAKTLGNVKLGSFLYWHDDLLTPTDPTDDY